MFMIWSIFGRHSNYGSVITKAIIISKIIPIGLFSHPTQMYLNYLRKYTWPKYNYIHSLSARTKTQNPVPIISIKGLPDRREGGEEGFWHENSKKDNFWKIKNSAAWRSLSTTKIFSQGQKFLISHIPNFWTTLNYFIICNSHYYALQIDDFCTGSRSKKFDLKCSFGIKTALQPFFRQKPRKMTIWCNWGSS